MDLIELEKEIKKNKINEGEEKWVEKINGK